MKPVCALVCIALSCGVAKGSTLLTFDDLTPGPDLTFVQDGYGGLLWHYFGVLDAPRYNLGFADGMVSSNNMAFMNYSFSPPSISRTNTMFDLNSAYLTAPGGTQVRAQGFAGPILAYDNAYTLGTNGPVLIHFNYTNVSRVKFTPSYFSGFYMDNLEITIHETPIPHAMVDVGAVQTSTIGHSFFTSYPEPPSPRKPNYVLDYLLDQSQSTGGGGVLPSVSVNWDYYDQFEIQVSAPSGFKFLVQVPAGRAVTFFGSLTWESTPTGWGVPCGPVVMNFDGLEGTAPDVMGGCALLAGNHSAFGFYSLPSPSVLLTNDLAFTSITLTGDVEAQHTGLGMLNFTAHTNSSLSFSYSTLETNDPGRFVFIVPVTPAPRISITAVSQEIGVMLSVQGQAGRTNVVQTSEDLVTWTSISTNVMPATLCPTCPFVNVTDATATNSARRFYRAVELP